MSESYGQSWYSLNKFIDTTTNWCPSDTEQRFNENMADTKQRAKMEEFGWTRENVSYTFNKDGFRSEEFTDGVNDSVLFLGCSLTAGIGVDLESSWAYKVASSLGLRRYNLGVGGGGPDMCFRLAHHWIPRLRPKYVMMLTPNAARMEIVLNDAIIPCLPNMTHLDADIMRKVEGFYNGWLSHPANADMNLLKTSLGVQSICNSVGVELIEIQVEKLNLYPNIEYKTWMSTLGRDLLHPGKEWHEAVTARFLDEII